MENTSFKLENEDPLVEIRKTRDEHAKKFNYDFDKIVEDLRKFEKQLKVKKSIFTTEKDTEEVCLEQAVAGEKKQKKFDCVEMKQRAQEKLLSEFEGNKGQYKSYVDFIEQKAKASSVQKKLLARIAKVKKPLLEKFK